MLHGVTAYPQISSRTLPFSDPTASAGRSTSIYPSRRTGNPHMEQTISPRWHRSPTGAAPGPPLVLIHGATADHQRWATVRRNWSHRTSPFGDGPPREGGSGDSPEYDGLREAKMYCMPSSRQWPRTRGQVNLPGHSFGGHCCLEGGPVDRQDATAGSQAGHRSCRPRCPEGSRRTAHLDRGTRKRTGIMFREVVQMPDHEFDMYRRLPVWPVRVTLAHVAARTALP